jgi:hypothetical protein
MATTSTSYTFKYEGEQWEFIKSPSYILINKILYKEYTLSNPNNIELTDLLIDSAFGEYPTTTFELEHIDLTNISIKLYSRGKTYTMEFTGIPKNSEERLKDLETIIVNLSRRVNSPENDRKLQNDRVSISYGWYAFLVCSILLASLSISFAQYSVKVCESRKMLTGSVGMDAWKPEDNHEHMFNWIGIRRNSIYISFSEMFEYIPQVHIGFSYTEMDNVGRLLIIAKNISKEGFVAEFTIWGDVIIEGAEANWFAF